ncbi:hypothetical protein T12_12443 [Trichinella patagoniensis]|uniref:Uncharacterized protein n=1 Tax=Trichinella patagoniensis TaxID=990121 RepID=A0A0V1A9F2_9BILA|nr:hypothetical protein T12_12443 [Trichinella patagoniensis]
MNIYVLHTLLNTEHFLFLQCLIKLINNGHYFVSVFSNSRNMKTQRSPLIRSTFTVIFFYNKHVLDMLFHKEALLVIAIVVCVVNISNAIATKIVTIK